MTSARSPIVGSITESVETHHAFASRRPRIWQATLFASLALSAAIIGVMTTPATTASAAFAVGCASFAVLAVVLLSNPLVVRTVAILTGSALAVATVLAIAYPREGGEVVVVGVVGVMLAALVPMLALASQRAAEIPRPVPFVLAGTDVVSDFIDGATVRSLTSQAGRPTVGSRAVRNTGRVGTKGRIGKRGVGVDGAIERETVRNDVVDTTDVHVLLTELISAQLARGKLSGKLGRIPDTPELADHSDVLDLVRRSPTAAVGVVAELESILSRAAASAEDRLIEAKLGEFAEASRVGGYQLIDAVWECCFSERETRLALHALVDGNREVPMPLGISLYVALPRHADGRPALSPGSPLGDGMKVHRNVLGRAERLDGTTLPVSPIAVFSWS